MLKREHDDDDNDDDDKELNVFNLKYIIKFSLKIIWFIVAIY